MTKPASSARRSIRPAFFERFERAPDGVCCQCTRTSSAARHDAQPLSNLEEGRDMSEQVTIGVDDLREIIKLLHARYDDERLVPRARYRELARKLEMVLPASPLDTLLFSKRVVIRLESI